MDEMRKLVLLIGLAGALNASAAVITFSGLSTHLTGFGTYTENGFTVTSVAGNWVTSLFGGNPPPSIFAGPVGCPVTSTLEITGGLFTFSSVDIGSNNGSSQFAFAGTLGGAPVFSILGSLGGGAFMTVNNSSSSAVIDRLLIGINPTGATSINIDNIVVTASSSAIPEPATAALWLAGLAGFALARRFRS
jgi:hypothetical protein